MASRPGEWLRRLSQTFVYRAPGERDECPACASRDIFELDILPLRAARTGFVSACETCGLVFSNPLPTAEDLADFYSPSGAWGVDRRDDLELDEPRRASGRVRGSWSRWFDPIRGELDVTSPPAGARVLDFGCGEGKLLDRLQTCGWETFGIEPSLDRAFRRHRRVEALPGEPTFDLVVLNHVLEHVANPLDLLKRLGQACRIGGYLLVAVPRFDTLPSHRDYRYVLNGRAHITAYTWDCLRTLLARAGWAPVMPPPAELSKGGGGQRTTSRLRVLARRVEGAVTGAELMAAEGPAIAAREAVRAYYASGDSRSPVARAGLLRLAARRADAQRRRARAERKATKHGAPSGSTAV